MKKILEMTRGDEFLYIRSNMIERRLGWPGTTIECVSKSRPDIETIRADYIKWWLKKDDS